MNKFATVYKYAMDKQAEHIKAYNRWADDTRKNEYDDSDTSFGTFEDWVDSLRNSGEKKWSGRDWRRRGEYVKAFAAPGWEARDAELSDPNYLNTWARVRKEIDSAPAPRTAREEWWMNDLRHWYPATQPSRQPRVRQELSDKMDALRKQPAPTITSQLGNAFNDLYGKPIANTYNSVKDSIGRYLHRINPLRTTS